MEALKNEAALKLFCAPSQTLAWRSGPSAGMVRGRGRSDPPGHPSLACGQSMRARPQAPRSIRGHESDIQKNEHHSQRGPQPGVVASVTVEYRPGTFSFIFVEVLTVSPAWSDTPVLLRASLTHPHTHTRVGLSE